MTSRIATVAINAIDTAVVADFWCAALGWRRSDEDDVDEDDVDEDDVDIVSIEPVDGSWPAIDIVGVPDRKSGFNRLHFDLRADGASFAEELERLLKVGATRVDVGQPKDVSWEVLADPEGNEFCLLRRTVEEVTAGRET